MAEIHRMSRREFLAVTGAAGAGLMLGLAIPLRDDIAALAASEETAVFTPNVLLQIARDGTATIWVARSEMGQGVRTGLPMIVAEELEARWEQVRIQQAPGANDGRYGPQLTGGSLSVRTLYAQLRRVGAVGRHMLVAAAAQQWGVDPGECVARDGVVTHGARGRKAAYGELVDAAAKLPVPDA